MGPGTDRRACRCLTISAGEREREVLYGSEPPGHIYMPIMGGIKNAFFILKKYK